jgi:hypothetical protein
MSSPAFPGQLFSIPMAPLITNCHMFQGNRILLTRPNSDIQSRVSVDSFRTLIGAIGGIEPDIMDETARGLWLLSNEFK